MPLGTVCRPRPAIIPKVILEAARWIRSAPWSANPNVGWRLEPINPDTMRYVPKLRGYLVLEGRLARARRMCPLGGAIYHERPDSLNEDGYLEPQHRAAAVLLDHTESSLSAAAAEAIVCAADGVNLSFWEPASNRRLWFLRRLMIRKTNADDSDFRRSRRDLWVDRYL